MKPSEAKAAHGGLGTPSKMPGSSYGLQALGHCAVGTALSKLPGTTCSSCYAAKGNYRQPVVRDAHERRAELMDTHPDWVRAIAWSIERESGGYHRWFDSGDLRKPGEPIHKGVERLLKITAVCRMTPEVKHWLPTREYTVVRQFDRDYTRPSNLVIRMSTSFIGHRTDVGGTGSGVWAEENRPPSGRLCPAPTQGNKCGECRSCWDKRVKFVWYRKH